MDRTHETKKELVKQSAKSLLKHIATSLSVVAAPNTAASIWLEKIFHEHGEKERRLEVERLWICKFVYVNPISSPTSVVWGHGETMIWREGLYGDVHIRHPIHRYVTPLSIDSNIGNKMIFDSEEELTNYLNSESERGNIREGSFRLTIAGAIELGVMTFDSLIEYVSNGEQNPIFISHDFLDLLLAGAEEFRSNVTFIQRWYRFDPAKSVSIDDLQRLSTDYPFEFNVLVYVMDYLFSMKRLAIFSETE